VQYVASYCSCVRTFGRHPYGRSDGGVAQLVAGFGDFFDARKTKVADFDIEVGVDLVMSEGAGQKCAISVRAKVSRSCRIERLPVCWVV
jgi:hypothetical protein